MSCVTANTVHTLYVDHHQWLFNWLTRRLQNADDAQDLSHDTYVRVIGSGRLPEEDSQSRSFLMQVAKGLVIDLHRRRALERTYLEALALIPEEYVPSVEDTEQNLELLIKIDEALDELPAKVRSAFLLSRFEGMKYSDIAARLEVSVGSVRKYMLKASFACMVALDSV